MSKALAQILAQWLQRSSRDSGPYPEPLMGEYKRKRRNPGGRGSSVALTEPEPELLVRALRQPRRTR
jgi:hypothetical protein